MAIYVLARHRATTTVRLAAAILSCLAAFQLAEYLVCTNSSFVWSRVGFITITFLPILGLHLIFALTGRSSRLITPLYVLGLLVASYFAVMPGSLNQPVCNGNYVIFRFHSYAYYLLYGLYYYGLLLYTAIFIFNTVGIAKRRRQSASWWLGIGYVAFMLPSAAAILIWPDAVKAVPSIMCGFALIFALILTLKVLPLTQSDQRLSKRLKLL